MVHMSTHLEPCNFSKLQRILETIKLDHFISQIRKLRGKLGEVFSLPEPPAGWRDEWEGVVEMCMASRTSIGTYSNTC